MAGDSVLIVGTISNVSRVLAKDFERVFKSLSRFASISTYLVESDSTDNTKLVLSEMKKTYPNFEYVELGDLRNNIPDRIERIRFCRNVYVRYIRSNYTINNWDFVVVVDLDGMNTAITTKSLNTCFTSTMNWDGCFANQKHGYYDLYALRHPEWMPNNCFDDLAKEKNKIAEKFSDPKKLLEKFRSIIKFDKARKISIYNKMHVIKKNTSWIKVDSAFGGLAIYKSVVFIHANYDKSSTSYVSEHVDFHANLMDTHPNLYINPKLINSNWNTYNINRYFVIRQFRNFLRKNPNFRNLIKRYFGGGGGI